MDQIKILPKRPGRCPVCGAAHDPKEPHERDSLRYMVGFYRKHGRWPTWADAMAHCSEEKKALSRAALLKKGVPAEEFEQDDGRMDGI